jgi:hypothetical protein
VYGGLSNRKLTEKLHFCNLAHRSRIGLFSLMKGIMPAANEREADSRITFS